MLLIRGVRPNSPMQTTSVVSSSPRSCKIVQQRRKTPGPAAGRASRPAARSCRRACPSRSPKTDRRLRRTGSNSPARRARPPRPAAGPAGNSARTTSAHIAPESRFRFARQVERVQRVAAAQQLKRPLMDAVPLFELQLIESIVARVSSSLEQARDHRAAAARGRRAASVPESKPARLGNNRP